MRILFTIPHYYDAGGGGRHGSLGGDLQQRINALRSCLSSIHANIGPNQVVLQIDRRRAELVNHKQRHQCHIVIVTTGGKHLLDQLGLPDGSYRHVEVTTQPRMLGFACHTILRQLLNQYDYFCYLEDDLVLHDAWHFTKLRWFTTQMGDGALLQPNRFELAMSGAVRKAYIDGDIAARATRQFQQLDDQPTINAPVLNEVVTFFRPKNPHAGCFFLNAKQMQEWANKPYFLDGDIRFVGPLESAATLGVMRTFQIFKPAPETASFLEIQHFGTKFLDLVQLKP